MEVLVKLVDLLLNECQKEKARTVEREWVVVVVKEQDGRMEERKGKC